MTWLHRVFRLVVIVDVLLFATMTVMTVGQPMHDDGGQEMALFFYVLVPSLVLVAAVLLFRFSRGRLPKIVALFIVTVPGLFYAQTQIESLLIDRAIEADRSGIGYFDGDAMRAMGAAVVARDVATLTRVGPTVDVNTVGKDGVTLLSLAVDTDFTRTPDRVDGDELPVVRALLALGSRPEQGLDGAVRRGTPALLALLLDAGANPNMVADNGQPLVFKWKSVITPDNFRALASHGLDLDARENDDPLPVVLAIYKRWDLLAIMIERGADTSRARPDGRNVVGELAHQIDEEAAAGHELPTELLRAKKLLDACSAPEPALPGVTGHC